MKIAVAGARGQLAQSLQKALAAHEITAATHGELDICDREAVRGFLTSVRPDVLINTAAYLRVDDCELEIDRCLRVNVGGAANLAAACSLANVWLLHFSTDYVFDGEKRSPYHETDEPRPLSVYGASKLAGEHAILSVHQRATIIRSSGLYGSAGSSGKGGNFVNLMLKLGQEGRPIRVVDDQVLAPTATDDLAESVGWLLENELHGVVHLTNAGECSWFQFAREIFRLSGIDADLTLTDSIAYGARARRPAYSVLANEVFAAAGGPPLRHWVEALASYLAGISLD